MPVSEAQKKWRAANKERVYAAQKRWREANPERVKDAFEIWYYLKGGRNKRLAATEQRRNASVQPSDRRIPPDIRADENQLRSGGPDGEGQAKAA